MSAVGANLNDKRARIMLLRQNRTRLGRRETDVNDPKRSLIFGDMKVSEWLGRKTETQTRS